MDRETRLLRQTLVLLFINAIWAITYYAVAPAFDRSLFEIALILIPALILLIGLLPNRYLQKFIDKIAKMSQQASNLGIRIIALFAPIFFLSVTIYFMAGAYTFYQEFTLDYLREREKVNMILFGISGGIQILFLIMNIRTLLSKSDQPQNISE